MSLIAAELERQGIATVAIQLLRSIAELVRPPRALCVPFRFGYPLGKPNHAGQQEHVLTSALRLLERTDATPPLIEDLVSTDGDPHRSGG